MLGFLASLSWLQGPSNCSYSLKSSDLSQHVRLSCEVRHYFLSPFQILSTLAAKYGIEKQSGVSKDLNQ